MLLHNYHNRVRKHSLGYLPTNTVIAAISLINQFENELRTVVMVDDRGLKAGTVV